MPALSDNQPSDETIDAALKRVLFAMGSGSRAGRESILVDQFVSLLATKAIRKAERDASEILARRCERFGDLFWDIQAIAEFLHRSPTGLFKVPGFPKVSVPLHRSSRIERRPIKHAELVARVGCHCVGL